MLQRLDGAVTAPFEPFDLTGACSTIVRARVLAKNTSPTKNLLIAGSWSVFRITALPRLPHSVIKSCTFLAACLPVDRCEGTATAFFILVCRSTTTKIVMLWPASSPGKQ